MSKIIAFIIALLLPVLANAFEIESGRQIGLMGGTLMSNPNADELLACPSGIGYSGRLQFSAGYNRQFELSDLDQVYAAGYYRYSKISFGLGFSQLGRSSYYTEQIIRGVVSYNYGYYNFGLTGSTKVLSIGADERKIDISAFGLGLNAGVNYSRYHLGLTLDNINHPVLGEGREGENMVANLYSEIEGSALFSLVGRISYEENYDPVFSLGQYFNLPNDNAIFLGIQSDPVRYGGGLDISYAGFGLTYSANYHSVLGFTHNVSLVYNGTKSEE